MLRLLLVVVVVGALAAWLLGYVPGTRPGTGPAVGTQTDRTIDPDAARQRGADAAGRVAEGVNRAARALDDGALTAKIKSKMALDDLVRAADIDVDTVAGTVTLTGSVASEAERERAVRLAKETAGVHAVQDRLTVAPPR